MVTESTTIISRREAVKLTLSLQSEETNLLVRETPANYLKRIDYLYPRGNETHQNINKTTFDRIECFSYLNLHTNCILKFEYSFNYIVLYISNMTRPKHRISATGEKSREERTQDATALYHRLQNSQEEISIRKAAKRHGVPWESVRDRVGGRVPRKKATEDLQKLTLFEEGIIESYCNTLYGWGWPARIY